MFVPFMCRISPRRPDRQAGCYRILLVYGREKEISSKDETIDPENNSMLQIVTSANVKLSDNRLGCLYYISPQSVRRESEAHPDFRIYRQE